MLANMAIEHRASFYKTYQSFHPNEYSEQHLQHSLSFSVAQGNRRSDD